MDDKDEHTEWTYRTDDEQFYLQKPPNEPRSRRREAPFVGVTIVLACLVLGLGMRWIYHTLSCKEDLAATPVSFELNVPSNARAVEITSLTLTAMQHSSITVLPIERIQRRDVAAYTSSDNNISLITDSEGTWIVETSGEATNSQDASPTQAALTTTEIATLTDHVIISYTTQTKISTVTVTTTAPQPTTSTSNSSESSSFPSNTSPTALKSTSSTPPTSITPTPTPLSSCPYLTCATACPWTTCTLHPTTMETNLCQMVDPCFFDQKGYLPRPPSQGGKCACLCESGWCTNPIDDKGRDRVLSCAEWDCCHECECFADNLMAEQRGNGRC